MMMLGMLAQVEEWGGGSSFGEGVVILNRTSCIVRVSLSLLSGLYQMSSECMF